MAGAAVGETLEPFAVTGQPLPPHPGTAGRLSARTLPIVWTADSRRVYYTVTSAGGANFPAVYRLGDSEVHALRFRAPPGFYVAALIP
jgi:hypothetical protein